MLVAGDEAGTPPAAVRADPSDVDDPVVLGAALPDGFFQMLPRDFIEPIYEPEFVPGASSEWPDDADVIGVAIGGRAKAYPVSLLNSREMVVDVIDDVPIVVTWCPLCGTAMVHRRQVGDETLVFGVQGALYLNAMTWWDHDTGSIWSQPLGQAIAGPRTGQTVELLPSEFTTWRSWVRRHPETLALDAPARATRFDLSDLFVVVDLGGETRGYPMYNVRRFGVVNDVVGGHAIAVVSDPHDADGWAVFSRRIDRAVVELAVVDGVLHDTMSGSTFDPASGRGVDGPLRDGALEQLPAHVSLPGGGPTRVPIFDAFWPEATVWRP